MYFILMHLWIWDSTAVKRLHLFQAAYISNECLEKQQKATWFLYNISSLVDFKHNDQWINKTISQIDAMYKYKQLWMEHISEMEHETLTKKILH